MVISNKKKTRRSFLAEALVSWIILMLLPIIYGITKYILPSKISEAVQESMKAAKVYEITPQTSKLVRFNNKPVLIIRNERGQIKALSAVCTHLGCIIQYLPVQRNFHCNCHGSIFDTDGKNISGPAPIPLAQFKVDIKSDDIIISKI
jgi:cytochrome b6-f complex iron-sulfur subunit